MSAAAGAPPPPPPPPPPPRMPSFSNGFCENLFDLLPAELLLIIYEHLGSGNPLNLMNLALAIYPTLEQHRIAPQLTANTYLSIVRVARTSTATGRILARPSPINRIPMELWLDVARDLEPVDILSMMLAIGVYPPRESITPETAARMRLWCRRSKRKDAS